MKDNFFREINYLRLSITDRCNLACCYCQPRTDWEKLPAPEILRYEEFLILARVAARMGIKKVRVTGGEPLMRRGVLDFLRNLRQVEGLKEICLTTNGVLLGEMANDLHAAGVRHLNLSLDTLRPERYREITGSDCFPQVMAGLEAAVRLGFNPLKINFVILKDINDDEVLDFAHLAQDLPLQVRFIEVMPTVARERWAPHFLPMAEVRRRLKPLGPFKSRSRRPTAGPAEVWQPRGFKGELGFISPVSSHHCPTCNRLRLTAAGKLRPCLFANHEVDLKTPLRLGAPEEFMAQLFQEAVSFKASRPGELAGAGLAPDPMVSIGG